jgi:two-component system, response regulator PdtaR
MMPERILIVEDDYLVASEMETALIQARFDVAGIATCASEALELVAAERPTIAIMDIRLGTNAGESVGNNNGL